jgi:CheY-like chemotaxis protein
MPASPSQNLTTQLDLMRLSDDVRAEIIASLDHVAAAQGRIDMRADDRHAIKMASPVFAEFRHPGGSRLACLIIPRNISRHGMAFLHGSFVYPGSACKVIMKTLAGQHVSIPGQVVRCSYVVGKVHDVGIRFEEPITPGEFVEGFDHNDEADAAPDAPVTPMLRGKVLYADDSRADRELVRFFCSKCGVTVVTAEDGEEAVKQAATGGFDAVLTDFHLPGMTGAELAEKLHAEGYTGPIIAVTADEKQATHDQAKAAGCTAVLVKPFESCDLLGLLSKYLQLSSDDKQVEPLPSSLWSQVKLRPLIMQFLDDMEQKLSALQKQALVGEAEAMLPLCLEIKGTAGSYGYEPIQRAAHELIQLLTAEQQSSAEELQDKCRALSRLANGARAAANR